MVQILAYKASKSAHNLRLQAAGEPLRRRHCRQYTGKFVKVLDKQLERKISILVLGALIVASTAAASHVPTCSSPKAVGGWLGGTGDIGNNEITRVLILRTKSEGAPIGWFYKLRDKSLYFQPALVLRKGKESTLVVADGRTAGPSFRVKDVSSRSAAYAIREQAVAGDVDAQTVPEPFHSLEQGRLETIVSECR